jgi:hypothetical protein
LLNKIDEYIPFNPGQATKLERELGRLPNNKDVPIGVLGVDEQIHRPVAFSRFIGLSKQTNIDDVKEQLRTLKPTVARLERSSDRKARLGHSISSTNLGDASMDGPSIEDHVRDFHYASAQLEESQLRHRDSIMSIPSGHHYGHSNMLLSDPNNIHSPNRMQSMPIGRRMGNLPNGHPPRDLYHSESNYNHLESGGHSRISSRSDADSRISYDEYQRRQVAHLQHPFLHDNTEPAFTHDLLAGRSHLYPNGHGITEDWRKDDFFQSSDSDMGFHAPISHSGNAILQHKGNFKRTDSEDEDELFLPQVKLHRSVADIVVTHSAPVSARQHLNGTGSGYSSFFGSEDEIDDRMMRETNLKASIESDDASHKSKDSGYDSGNSHEGFADETANDEQEERRNPKKNDVDDADMGSSRHQHVPETRLRKRRGTEEVRMVSASALDGTKVLLSSNSASVLVSSSSSSSAAAAAANLNSSISLVRPESKGDLSSRSDGPKVPESVQPLLSSSSISSSPIIKRTRPSPSSMNEIEMSQLRRNNMDPSEPLPLSSENPNSLVLFNPSNEASPSNYKDEETHVDLHLELHPPEAPPRTTFYQMPDPRHLNRSKAIKGLQSGFSELYRGMHLLKRYAELNVEATDKVLAKYEKNIARGHRHSFMREEISRYNFSKGQELRSLISQTEHVYAQAFTGGHRTPAMQKLRVPEEEDDMESTTLRFGLLFGISLGFAIIILYMCIVVKSSVVQKMRPDLIVFRMLFITTLMLWYWGVDMWIWSAHRVNYPFIFEFNTRGHMRYQNIFDIASVFTVVLIGDMMLYMLTALQHYDPDFNVPGFEYLRHVPPETYPLILVILLLGLLLFYSVRSGFWLVRTMGRIVTAPLNKVVFRDFFMADQLVSISLVLQDIDFTICYFTTCAFRGGGNSCASNHVWMGAILSTLPQLWRLLQCFRRYRDSKDKTNLYNAGKYTTGMLVAICSSMRSIFKSTSWLVLWLIIVIIATIYSYGWDIYKDWSIGDRKSANWMLRDQLLYPKWWYYAAAIANLILRLMWTFTISPDVVATFFFLGKDGFTTLLVAVEVSRRAMWNIFRLENEQLNNCGRFRAVQDIPLPLPLKPAVEENLYQDKIK